MPGGGRQRSLHTLYQASAPSADEDVDLSGGRPLRRGRSTRRARGAGRQPVPPPSPTPAPPPPQDDEGGQDPDQDTQQDTHEGGGQDPDQDTHEGGGQDDDLDTQGCGADVGEGSGASGFGPQQRPYLRGPSSLPRFAVAEDRRPTIRPLGAK